MAPIDFLNQAAAATKLNQKYFAAVAALAYDFNNLATVSGLEFLQRAPQKAGYDAAVYFHKASSVLIFANRGTDGFRSYTDWIEGGAAAIGAKFSGPLTGSVNFVLDTLKKLGAAKGIGTVKLSQVSEISCTGHSWGGACTEAQVALSQAMAMKLKQDFPVGISGVGFGSAGFADAINAYAKASGIAVEDDMHWMMNHFIRTADPILLQPNHELLGESYAIPGIYVTGNTPSPNGRGFEFGLNAPMLTNHDSRLYFDQFELRGAKHIFKRSDGKYLLCEGIVPPKMRFGTQRPEATITGVPLP